MNKERLTQLAGILEEAFKVTFTNKDGTPGQATFPNEKLATMYSKTVKNGQVVPVDTEMADVSVTKAPEATLDDLRASAKTFYKQAQRGEKFDPRRPPPGRRPSRDPEVSSEQAAEQEAEFWAASRAAGQSTEDAFADLDYMRGVGRRRRSAHHESSLKAVMGDFLQEVTLSTRDGREYSAPNRDALEKVLVKMGVPGPERTAIFSGQIPITPETASALVRAGAAKKVSVPRPASAPRRSSYDPYKERDKVRKEWEAALDEFEATWEDYDQDVPPDQAAYDAGQAFFWNYPQWKKWASALGMSKMEVEEVVADRAYEGMMKGWKKFGISARQYDEGRRRMVEGPRKPTASVERLLRQLFNGDEVDEVTVTKRATEFGRRVLDKEMQPKLRKLVRLAFAHQDILSHIETTADELDGTQEEYDYDQGGGSLEDIESLESELADLEAQEMAISNEYEALEAEVFR